jgi:chromosome partitioning protein
MIALSLFSPKAGVGQTTLAFHLAWMFAERGVSVLVVDLDPQSDMTALFLGGERRRELQTSHKTILAPLEPLLHRSGAGAAAHGEKIRNNLHLVAGDLGLSLYEDRFAECWVQSEQGDEAAYQTLSSVWSVVELTAAQVGASLVILDLGPNLGPLNRAALLAADHLAWPVTPSFPAMRAMELAGPTLRRWREGWGHRLAGLRGRDVAAPLGRMEALGYVLVDPFLKPSDEAPLGESWGSLALRTYGEFVAPRGAEVLPRPDQDPWRLAKLRHYRSLIPMALEARKPMFLLKASDGARGAHVEAVQACYQDFLALARTLGPRIGVPVP